MRGHLEWYLMTVKVKHSSKIIMTFLTTIEIFRHSWSKSSKLKKVLLLRSWDLSLKEEKNTYNVRHFHEFEAERKATVYFGLKTINYRSLQLRSLLPEHIRQLSFVDQFKRSVRQWVCYTTPCRLCKVYLKNIAFL